MKQNVRLQERMHLEILHTTPLGGLVVPFGVFEL